MDYRLTERQIEIRDMERHARNMTKFSAICKLHCSDIAMSVATDAVKPTDGKAPHG